MTPFLPDFLIVLKLGKARRLDPLQVWTWKAAEGLDDEEKEKKKKENCCCYCVLLHEVEEEEKEKKKKW